MAFEVVSVVKKYVAETSVSTPSSIHISSLVIPRIFLKGALQTLRTCSGVILILAC